MFKYTTTFIKSRNKSNGNFYDYIFDKLERLNFNFVDIQNEPDIIFHQNFEKVNSLDNKIIDFISDEKKIVDTNIFMNYLSDLEKKNYIYEVLFKFKIPHLKQTNIGDIDKNNLEFPFVLKEKNTSQGKGIYFIENQDQLNKLKKYNGNYFENNFRHSKFIETESNHYNHFRIFTLGSGKILASTLNYSNNKKEDLDGILYSNLVFDNPDSMLYLNQKNIVSNISQGSNSIALNPNKYSKKLNSKDKEILNSLNIKNQQLPNFLNQFASYTAEVFNNYGFYILGQDWIQEKNSGKYYCLEVNYIPQTNIFNTLYNKGKNDIEFGKQKAAELIAQGINENLIKIKN